MNGVMRGVRILEVGEQVFVPSAAALLSDLGADVIKIEHVERGDSIRGIASTGVAQLPPDVHPYLHHNNRGKRSLGVDLALDEGRQILYRLAEISDVFITNKLSKIRSKLKIDVEDLRAHNSHIIYARGSGQGEYGPDADQGSYDQLAFWSRAGVASAVMRPDYDHVPMPPPGLGDSVAALALAGGIMGALFHRGQTGEASVVDVSLLGSGLWAMSPAVALSLALGLPYSAPPVDAPRLNPLWQFYLTSDNRWIALTCLQADKYWAPLCKAIGRPELGNDPRFADHVSLLNNTTDAEAILREAFAALPLQEWRKKLEHFSGQWAVVQDLLEAATDRQSVANGYIQECQTSAGRRFGLVSVPIQYDEELAPTRRAPEFNEQGDEILAELGFDWGAIVDMKVRGVVA